MTSSIPIRRWTQAQTDAAGVAFGTTVPDIKIDIPRDGWIVAIYGAVFDPTTNTNETINLTADAESGVTLKINDESPTNFKSIRTRSFAGTKGDPREYRIPVRINDNVRVDFTNNRTVGNPLQFRLDIGLADPSDVPGGEAFFR
jgi:hypothetical protein